MLKIRVIPTLLIRGTGLVKGLAFDSWRRVGTILPAIRVYNTRDVDELIVVDILATTEKREPDYVEVQNFSGDCFVPLTVGGGIAHLDHVKKLLRSGADKVCLNSVTHSKPEFVRQVSEQFGSQCVVVSVDAVLQDATYRCATYSGQKMTDMPVLEFCQQMQSLGAGEILLTSVLRDGTQSGYDLNLIKLVAPQIQIPVIASGGAGSYADMDLALQQGASAVAAAAMFHYTEQTPRGAKDYLSQRGYPVRGYHAT